MILSFDKNEILKNIKNVTSFEELEKIRLEFLGKKGLIPTEMKSLGQLSIENKKAKGQELNLLKQILEDAINNQKSVLENNEITKRIENENHLPH